MIKKYSFRSATASKPSAHGVNTQMDRFVKCPAINWLFAAPLLRTDHQCLRYVDVTRFTFHVLQPLPIRCAERNLCCISKSMMKYEQKSCLP